MQSGKSTQIKLIAKPEPEEVNIFETYGITNLADFIDSRLIPMIAEVTLHFQTESADFLTTKIKWPSHFAKCLNADFESTIDYYNYFLTSILPVHQSFIQLEHVKSYLEQNPEKEKLSQERLNQLKNCADYIREIYLFSITRLYLYTVEILKQKNDFELSPVFFNEIQSFELEGDTDCTQERLAQARCAIILSILRKIDFNDFRLCKDVINILHQNPEIDRAKGVLFLMSHFDTIESMIYVKFKDNELVSPRISNDALADAINLLAPTFNYSASKQTKVRCNTEVLENLLDFVPVSIARFYLLNLFILSKFKFFTHNFNLHSDKPSEIAKLLDTTLEDFFAHVNFIKLPKTFMDFNATKTLASFIIMAATHLIKVCCILGLTLNVTKDNLEKLKTRLKYFERALALADLLIEFDKHLLANKWAFNIRSYMTLSVNELLKTTKVIYVKTKYQEISLGESTITRDLILLKSEINTKLKALNSEIESIEKAIREQEDNKAKSKKIREKNHEKFYQEVLKESRLQRAKMIQEWEKSEKIKAERERARNKAIIAAKKKKAQESEEKNNNPIEEKSDAIQQKFKEACVLLNSNKLEEARKIYTEIVNSPTCSVRNTIEALMYISDYHQKMAKRHVRDNNFKEAAQHFYGALFNATSAVKLIQKNSEIIPPQLCEAAKDRLHCNRLDLKAFDDYSNEILLKAKLEREEFIKNYPDKWKKGNPHKPSQKTLAFSSLITSAILIERANQKYREMEQMIPFQNQQAENNPMQPLPNSLITKFMIIIRDSNGRVIKDKFRKSLDDMVLLNPSYLSPFLKSELGEEAYSPRCKKFIINELARDIFREIFAQKEFRYDKSELILQTIIDR